MSNNDLTFEALGVLTWARQTGLSQLTVGALMERGCREHTARRILRELRAGGYVTMRRARNERGQLGATVYDLTLSIVEEQFHMEEISHVEKIFHVEENTAPVGNARMRERAALTAQRQIQDPPLSPQRTESPPPRRSRAARPVFADVDEPTRLALIRGWSRNLGAAAPLGVEKRDRNHTTAAELARAGFSADDVAAFVKAKMTDPYWRGKTLTLQKVAELLPGWKTTRHRADDALPLPPVFVAPTGPVVDQLTDEERAAFLREARRILRAVPA